MKRTGFKIKPRKPMKRGKLKKESKQKISLLQKKVWAECKRIIRGAYGNTCYTCGATGLVGSNWHTGHLIPKSTLGANLKYDLRVLRPQCANCNIWGGGRGADFVRNMIMREGQEFVDRIFQERTEKPIKAHDYYIMLSEKYKLMLQDLV